MNRREARKQAFFILFQYKFRPEEAESMLNDFLEQTKVGNQSDYINDIVLGVNEKVKEIDAVLEEYSNDWKIDRISSVSLAALRLAAYEMMYMPDIPAVVSVNEAVALAKEFEGDEAAPFVNGILGKMKEKLG